MLKYKVYSQLLQILVPLVIHIPHQIKHMHNSKILVYRHLDQLIRQKDLSRVLILRKISSDIVIVICDKSFQYKKKCVTF